MSEYCSMCGAPITYVEERLVFCTDCLDALDVDLEEEEDEDEDEY